MRIIICGDRNWTDREFIDSLISKLPKDTVIIHGGCKGADSIAGALAEKYGLTVEAYAADWDGLGKAAGPARNHRMLFEGHPDMVVAFHDHIEDSKGTKDMLRQAGSQNVPAGLMKHPE